MPATQTHELHRRSNMKQASGSAVRTPAAIKRPPKMVARDDVSDQTDGTACETSRQAQILVAAYTLYEARGCVDGHDLDDWLAAEAAVARQMDGPRSAVGDH
jgi:Protein of unknown function (DUF2934)